MQHHHTKDRTTVTTEIKLHILTTADPGDHQQLFYRTFISLPSAKHTVLLITTRRNQQK